MGCLAGKRISSNIFQIDAETLTVKLLDRLPEETATWTKLAVPESDSTLSLEIPGQLSTIAVDTGLEGGVALVSQKWREWKAANTNAPLTLTSIYSPSAGFAVCEEAWAKELSLGAFSLAGVPVRQAKPIESARGQSILGLAALKRLDFILDGKHGWAYLRPKRTPPAPYQHNRLGAVFAPRHSRSEEVVAQVLKESPADAAGVRNGDILLKIDDSVVTKWRVQDVPLYRFWERPAGTKLDLTLKRGEETLKISDVLKDILLP